jgi:putative sigma-54 modulation protein
MEVTFTARRFRARPELKELAVDAVKKLDRFYDGIVSANIILSFERATNSKKAAEINLHVHGKVLSATASTDEYEKSVDAAVEKLMTQLSKYKTKLKSKDKAKVRSIKEEPAE